MGPKGDPGSQGPPGTDGNKVGNINTRNYYAE